MEQNLESARLWLVEQERISAGIRPRQPKTIEGVINEYLKGIEGTVKPITLEGYDRSLKVLSSTLGTQTSPLLAQQDINNYVSNRMREGAGRGITKELSYFRSALKHCGLPTEWSIPRRLSRIPKKVRRVPQPGEVKRLLDGLSHEDSRLAVLLALLAGLRDEEVYRISFDMIDSRERILRIPGAVRKTGLSNDVPICDTLWWFLPSLKLSSKYDPLVGLSKSMIKTDLVATCKKLDMAPWYGLQPARRALVTWAEDAGYSQDSIALVTGHSRGSMVSNYSVTSGRIDLKREIIESVERRLTNGKEIHHG